MFQKGHWDFLQNKVPEITLAFWMIKILSTTVGETVADYLTVNVGLGHSITQFITWTLLILVLIFQVRQKRYIPWIYWLSVVLISIVWTQITDFFTDTLGVSLYITTPIFFILLLTVFWVWYKSENTLSIHEITTRKRELFYWWAILCTFALGTASGDLATEAFSLWFTWWVAIFGFLILSTYLIFRLWAWAVLTFWIGYILTRPFWASLGDLLTQDVTYGGLWLWASLTSIIFLAIIILLVWYAQYNHTKKS